mgnify:CR=1 FL=1
MFALYDQDKDGYISRYVLNQDWKPFSLQDDEKIDTLYFYWQFLIIPKFLNTPKEPPKEPHKRSHKEPPKAPSKEP